MPKKIKSRPRRSSLAKSAGPVRSRRAQEKSAAQVYVSTSYQSLHDLFLQQTAAILENADLSQEEKQSILVATNCPCCGSGAMSFGVKFKLKREPAPASSRRFIAE